MKLNNAAALLLFVLALIMASPLVMWARSSLHVNVWFASACELTYVYGIFTGIAVALAVVALMMLAFGGHRSAEK